MPERSKDPLEQALFGRQEIPELKIVFIQSELQYCLLQSVADDIQNPAGRRVIDSEHRIDVWLGVE